MKAAVYRGPRDIKVEDVSEPCVSGRQVLVKFRAGSICGTDLHFYRGEWRWMKHGRIIGHDACGVRVDTGERVVMVPLVYCGKCYYCLRGLPTYCVRGKFMGLTSDGFFAEAIAIRPGNLIPMPDCVSDEEAAIVEPVALALHVMDALKPNVGDWATIIGQGAIGLLMTQIARLKGCRVIAVDVRDYRLRLAEKYGAEICINAAEEDAVKRVRAITGRGSDMVVEAAGTVQTVQQTPFLVRKAGKVALVGESKGYLNLEDADDALFFTTYISPVEYPLAVQLLAEKRVDVRGLVTHRFSLADFEKALQTADTPETKPLKVVITA
ncbi:MAG: zinc-binding dehydrogenase [Candidatus Bathyarchaeota archaeon]|nr:zinc-binding dehydrogenase [Candidatus Bathyarchaeota archaeon]